MTAPPTVPRSRSGQLGEFDGSEGHRAIVVVEDDPHISDLVAMYLRRDGFRVLQVGDGEQGIEAVRDHDAALAVVDVGLPGKVDGFEVCRRLQASRHTPVIMLTARDDEVDRIVGLELGADDYVTKPFSPRELVARVRAVLRRSEARPEPPAVWHVGDYRVDESRREVQAEDGTLVALTAREFDLLVGLVRNRGKVLSRRQLLDAAWDPGWYGDERTIDVHVRQLRKKLGEGLQLRTVRGVGYRLD